MAKKNRKENVREARKRAMENALPDVKKLVRKHGMSAVVSCLNNLKDYEKKLKELASAQAEVKRLEKEVGKK